MIEFEMIKKICKEHDNCCTDCPFRSKHLPNKFYDCMFYSFPYNWDLEEITKAFDDTHMMEQFRDGVMKKILEVMKMNRSE